jgi:hypothetical protein
MKKSLDIKQVDQSSRKKPPKVKKTSEKEEGPFYTQVLHFSLHPHQKSKSRKRFRKRKKKKTKIIKRFSIPHGLLDESDGPISSSSLPSIPTHILGKCPTSGH